MEVIVRRIDGLEQQRTVAQTETLREVVEKTGWEVGWVSFEGNEMTECEMNKSCWEIGVGRDGVIEVGVRHEAVPALEVRKKGWKVSPTGLVKAVRQEEDEIVKLMLEAGVPIDSIVNQTTSLSRAAQNDQLSMVSLLLSYGANPRDALTSAISRGSLKTVKYLVSVANIPISPTHLHLASRKGHFPVVVFLAPLTDIDYQDPKGRTPLMYAALHGHFNILRCLLHHQSNPFLRDASKDTALSLSCARKRTPVQATVQLAWAGSVLDSKNKRGVTPFMLCCEAGDLEKAEFLLSLSVNIEARSRTGFTPLMLAAKWSGSLPIVSLLLDTGANPCARNALGQIAEEIARKRGNTAIYHVLRNTRQSYFYGK
eukprot:TRINITY_DN37008_c0_g1_i1.p1 TRINITY_DN37008_c0_g1~~TRINITY_DN37008_c0_g1_i1.p1  ORF type:complete len:370 (+),score=36.24 TRINITY_DN37008_c0_g1_i1:67-1176(+)